MVVVLGGKDFVHIFVPWEETTVVVSQWESYVVGMKGDKELGNS